MEDRCTSVASPLAGTVASMPPTNQHVMSAAAAASTAPPVASSSASAERRSLPQIRAAMRWPTAPKTKVQPNRVISAKVAFVGGSVASRAASGASVAPTASPAATPPKERTWAAAPRTNP